MKGLLKSMEAIITPKTKNRRERNDCRTFHGERGDDKPTRAVAFGRGARSPLIHGQAGESHEMFVD